MVARIRLRQPIDFCRVWWALGVWAVLNGTCSAAEISIGSPDATSIPRIVVNGNFVLGDERTFRRIAVTIPNAIVVFNSRGGSLIAGIEIGKAIRLQGYATTVAQDGFCASACALAWIAGVPRHLPKDRQVGFHVAYTASGDRAEVSGQGNAIAGAYLSQLGLPNSAIMFATSVGPNEIRWLSARDAREIGIEISNATAGNAEGKRYTDRIEPETTPASPVAPPTILTRPGAAPKENAPRIDKPLSSQKSKAFVAFRRKDYATALKILPELAQSGDAQSQNLLGYMMDSGLGAKQDFVSAAYWYKSAADQGLAEAKNNLGFLFEHGRGVKPDFKRATALYTDAAELGSAAARANLAMMYFEGRGVRRNLVEAYKWILLATEAKLRGSHNYREHKRKMVKFLKKKDVAKAEQLAKAWRERTN